MLPGGPSGHPAAIVRYATGGVEAFQRALPPPVVQPDRYARAMKPEIASRARIAGAARLLLAGTLVIVIDVRIDQFDVIADAVGGVLVLVGILRVQSSVRGAEAVTTLMLVLALIGLVASIIETVSVNNILALILATAQPIGTVLLADVLAKALAADEPALSATWRMTYRLVLWLGVVPLLLLNAIGLASGGLRIETPLVLALLVIMAVPLVYLLVALSRTTRLPAVAATTPE